MMSSLRTTAVSNICWIDKSRDKPRIDHASHVRVSAAEPRTGCATARKMMPAGTLAGRGSPRARLFQGIVFQNLARLTLVLKQLSSSSDNKFANAQ